MTIDNNTGLSESCNWNEYNLNHLTRNNWRASLVPAAAVIPAPIAYIKVVAVKKLVVELWARWVGPPNGVHWPWWVHFFGWPVCSLLVDQGWPRLLL